MQQIVKNLFCVYGRFILGLQLVLVSDTTQNWNITMISEKQITYLAKISSGFGVNMSIISDITGPSEIVTLSFPVVHGRLLFSRQNKSLKKQMHGLTKISDGDKSLCTPK